MLPQDSLMTVSGLVLFRLDLFSLLNYLQILGILESFEGLLHSTTFSIVQRKPNLPI